MASFTLTLRRSDYGEQFHNGVQIANDTESPDGPNQGGEIDFTAKSSAVQTMLQDNADAGSTDVESRSYIVMLGGHLV